jgi:hypothetical protein
VFLHSLEGYQTPCGTKNHADLDRYVDRGSVMEACDVQATLLTSYADPNTTSPKKVDSWYASISRKESTLTDVQSESGGAGDIFWSDVNVTVGKTKILNDCWGHVRRNMSFAGVP